MALDQIHRYVGRSFPLLTLPNYPQFALSSAQVDQFARDGFVSGIRVLNAEQLAELRERLEWVCRELPRLAPELYEIEAAYRQRPEQVVRHFLGGWRVDSTLHDLVFAPQVTVPLAQVLGVRRLRLWHDQVFYKPPRHPGVVPWHQDYSYWTRTTPLNHVTMNIMLDDADLDSGCVSFVPGSHRWGVLDKVPFDAAQDAVLASLPPAQRAAFTPVPALLRAGEASIHHGLTLHGSGPNATDRPRRALVVNCMGASTRCADGSRPLLAHVPLLPAGAVIEGDAFPIVLDLDLLPGSLQ